MKKVKGSRDHSHRHRNRIVPLGIRQHYGKPATSRRSKISYSSQIYDVAAMGWQVRPRYFLTKYHQLKKHKISSVGYDLRTSPRWTSIPNCSPPLFLKLLNCHSLLLYIIAAFKSLLHSIFWLTQQNQKKKKKSVLFEKIFKLLV